MSHFYLSVLVLVCWVSPSLALAWGEDGHHIVCEIAWQNLESEAKEEIREMLEGDDDPTFAVACSWADRVLRTRDPSFNPYHFVNAPERSASIQTCAGKCVISGIERFEKVLRDPSSSSKDRLEAVKLVGHFVGDIHQPLHASYSSDKGGNSVAVTFLGKRSNLHKVWDSLIIEQANLGWSEYATGLAEKIHPIDRTLWSGGTPLDWANESYQVVEDLVYDDVPSLGSSYYQRARGVVENRLQAGGLRLAELLNEALRASRAALPRLLSRTPSLEVSSSPSSSNCTPRSECCRVCSKGLACGASCISASKTCRKGRGCACNASEVCR